MKTNLNQSNECSQKRKKSSSNLLLMPQRLPQVVQKVFARATVMVATGVTTGFLFTGRVFAQSQGSVIQIGSLDNLIWSVVKTLQFYGTGLGVLSVAFFGIKLVMSSDDTAAKENAKGWMIRLAIGTVLLFGATTIFTLLRDTVQT